MFVMIQGGGGQHSRVCGEVSRRRSRQQLRLGGVSQQRLGRPSPLRACTGYTLPSTSADLRARLRLAPRRVGQLCAAQTTLGYGACGSGLPGGRLARHRLDKSRVQQLRHHGVAERQRPR